MTDRDPLAGALILAFPKPDEQKRAADVSSGAQDKDLEKPTEARSPDSKGRGGGDDGSDDVDGIVARMNEEWAFVLMGSRALVLRETPQAPIADRVRMISIDAFRAYHLNKFSTVKREGEDGETKYTIVKWAPRWLGSKRRRTYDGVEFFPDPLMRGGTENYFNFWRGFAVLPAGQTYEESGRLVCRYQTFRDHLLNNVCGGNEDNFKWLFAWNAHIVQHPRERVGTAIVLRGGQGFGKTKVGEVFGSLYPSHYHLIDQPHHLTGQFNVHMVSCLLLQVDEGFWAGDKAAEGRLKGMVTSKTQMIEAKGVDPIELPNYLRVLFSSNEDWVVPAGLDERRFAVLDVAATVAQNHDYFAEMERELDDGGRAALLADLLAFDLDSVNLRVIPKTAALLEQKLRSLDPITRWWFERLSDGTTSRRAAKWYTPIPIDTLYNDYVHNAEQIGDRRRAEKIAFGMKLQRLIPGLEVTKRKVPVEVRGDDGHMITVEKRTNVYKLPPLAECRAAFEKLVQQPIQWVKNDPDDPEPEETRESGDWRGSEWPAGYAGESEADRF